MRHSRITILGLLSIAVALGSLGAWPSSSSAAPLHQSVTAVPNSGPPGLTISLQGNGFAPGFPSQIKWDGAAVHNFTMPANPFSINFTVPFGASPGGHTITICGNCGDGEFEENASTGFTVVAPTATHTPTSPATNTPTSEVIVSLTPTASRTPTPTIEGCIDSIRFLEPENTGAWAADLGGVPSVNLVVEIVYGGTEPLEASFFVNHRSEPYALWPSADTPNPIEVETDPFNPFRRVFTLRSVPLVGGYNEFSVRLTHTCMHRDVVYLQAGNGVDFIGTPRPDMCGGLGLDPEATVIDFDRLSGDVGNLAFYRDELGVSFESSLGFKLLREVVPRSGYRAGSSIAGFEFGSAYHPIKMNFSRPLAAVGLFVGMETVFDVRSQVTAHLSVYGYRAGVGSLQLLGGDSTSFPPEPTDVLHCLRFEAAEGDLIARAVVDYLDEAGTSIAEDRLIDDLTMVYASSPLPEDLPPDVSFTSPNPAEIVSGSTIYFRAEIFEDRELRQVTYQVNDREPVEVGFFGTTERPDHYFTGFNLGSGGFDYTVPNTFTITAVDSAGQIGGDSLILTLATPVPTLDVELVDLEIVQAVQCLQDPGCPDGSIPLYAGKPTLIRAYLRSTGGPPGAPITGRICRGFVPSCPLPDVVSINSVLPGAAENPVRTDRLDINASLNFMVPMDWTGLPAEVPFTVFVNYLGENQTETRYDNNTAQRSAILNPAKSMTVIFVRAEVEGTLVDYEERWPMADWLTRVFPISRMRVTSRTPDFVTGDYDLTDRSGDGCYRGWGRLMDVLRGAYFWSGRGKAHLLGMVPDTVNTGGVIGCGETPGQVASSITTPGSFWGAVVAAQELAHNQDRRHAPGCDAGGVDGGYRRPQGLLDVTGVDVAALKVYPAASSYDYMGYCGGADNTWTSAYTYAAMARTLAGAVEPFGFRLAAPRPQTTSVFLVGGGEISQDGFELTRPFMQAELPADTSDDLPLGPYTVAIHDSTGLILFQRDFGLIPLSNHDQTERGSFLIALPVFEETDAIVFLAGGSVLGTIEASASAPQIELLAPSPGESWPAEGRVTISWQASDADGDPLSYNLQYSLDGGQSWRSLSPNLKNTTEFTLDAASLPGGEWLLRVLASDGLHTGEARLAAPVHVPGKGPDIYLASPFDGSIYPAGQAVVMRGFAADMEQEELPEEAFSWSSNLDGPLGTGSQLWGVPLQAGQHQLTLTVTDADGNSASETVNITVAPSVAGGQQPASRPSPLVLLLIVAGIGLLGAAGVGLLVFAVRSRRA